MVVVEWLIIQQNHVTLRYIIGPVFQAFIKKIHNHFTSEGFWWQLVSVSDHLFINVTFTFVHIYICKTLINLCHVVLTPGSFTGWMCLAQEQPEF